MSHFVYYAVVGVSIIAMVLALHSSRYRPERHYMRGPGPKWRQKQGRE